jgi:putative phosphoribosyl transferase
MRFINRVDAGRRLAAMLERHRGPATLVVGLPRGGVPVAFEIAAALDAELDIWSVRKLGVPGWNELGMGAVAEQGVVYLDPEMVAEISVSEGELDRLIALKRKEVEERALRFRDGAGPPQVRGRTVILVDDGIATGGTVRAAIDGLRSAGAAHLVLAVPVAASQALEMLGPRIDELACVHATPSLYAIGAWYDDFTQVDDEGVLRLLRLARARGRRAPAAAPARGLDPQEVTLPLDRRSLEGTLTVPQGATGLVLFAHGSGSSRLSHRNQYVASVLNRRRLATLLFDLLTDEEERVDAITAKLRFDIGLLALRLLAARRWVSSVEGLRSLPLGYFGASTGAAAALVAAAKMPEGVSAIVSRGGRGDLAGESLTRVRAPTLLIVGSADIAVLELNRHTAARLNAANHLSVVPGATHLFEEPGALDAVAQLAGEWFERYLVSAPGEHPAQPGA